jgi:hypothetical protein
MVLLSPSLALAQPAAATPGMQLIEQGLDLRQAGRDAEALELFEKAQLIAPSPRGQAQVALAQQALGRWLLAEKNLRAALAVKDDTWIESRRPILERSMAVIGAHLGDVEVVGAKSGSVYVDGVRNDSTEALTHLRLEVGRRTFEIRAAGYYPFSRVLDVLPGEIVRVEVEQHPLLEESGGLAPPRVAPVLVAPTAPQPSRTRRTVAWISLGGAAAFLATGFVGLAERTNAVGDFNGSSQCTGTASNRLSSEYPQCSGWLNQGTVGLALEIAGFTGAAGLGALSVAMFVTSGSRPRPSALSVPCLPAAGGAGIWCGMEGVF